MKSEKPVGRVAVECLQFYGENWSILGKRKKSKAELSAGPCCADGISG
jgi:hypothetical protein